MTTRCLTGLIGCLLAASLGAQDPAPDVVGNTIWEFDRTSTPALPRSSMFMSANGTAYILNPISTPLEAPRPYWYRKTGPATAVLELGTPGVAPYTLQFSGGATFTSRFGSGRLRITPVSVPAAVALRNISTRVTVAANQTSLAGFVVAGAAQRRVLIRAVGPSLAQFGVTNTAPGTVLALTRGTTELAANRGWGGWPYLAEAFVVAGAFALPAGSRDSALLVTLPPGDYVAQARADGGAGEILIEVYFIN